MPRKSLIAFSLVFALSCSWIPTAEAKSTLTEDKIVVALRPELPEDRDWIHYVVTLLEQGRLPQKLVEGTFLWAREKPQHKYRYFKQALILRADKEGIELPQSDPPPYSTIEGVVVYQVKVGLLTIKTPVKGATVRLIGTERETTTDKEGKFSFAKVPFGVYEVSARGKVLLILRQGSEKVTLPTKPPSEEPAHTLIVVH